jgi:hypothetical protein
MSKIVAFTAASALVLLAEIGPSVAQDATGTQPPAMKVDGGQNNPAKAENNPASEPNDGATLTTGSIEESLKAGLAREGFSDIQMAPMSFLVRAKDQNGNPVMLMLSPGGAAQVKEADPSVNGGRTTDGSSRARATTDGSSGAGATIDGSSGRGRAATNGSSTPSIDE